MKLTSWAGEVNMLFWGEMEGSIPPFVLAHPVDKISLLTSSLRTPRNINLTIFLGKNAKNRAFLV